jgi:hypothetical protein
MLARPDTGRSPREIADGVPTSRALDAAEHELAAARQKRDTLRLEMQSLRSAGASDREITAHCASEIALDHGIAELRQRLAPLRRARGEAVAAALAPLRREAAAQILEALDDLRPLFDLLGSTAAEIDRAGGSAERVPPASSLDSLAARVTRIAK